jgi:hypothetical protein
MKCESRMQPGEGDGRLMVKRGRRNAPKCSIRPMILGPRLRRHRGRSEYGRRNWADLGVAESQIRVVVPTQHAN